MSKITLTRTGQAPLTFEGEQLASSCTQTTSGQGQNRWHAIAVYRTSGGAYVVSVEYHTQWDGEENWFTAQTSSDPAAVEVILRQALEASLSRIEGYPPGEAYADKQRRMLLNLRNRYESAVSEILSAEPEFAERVD